MTGLWELVLTALTGHLNFIRAINIQNKPIISTCYLGSFSTSTVFCDAEMRCQTNTPTPSI